MLTVCVGPLPLETGGIKARAWWFTGSALTDVKGLCCERCWLEGESGREYGWVSQKHATRFYATPIQIVSGHHEGIFFGAGTLVGNEHLRWALTNPEFLREIKAECDRIAAESLQQPESEPSGLFGTVTAIGQAEQSAADEDSDD
jgi:hypothetical protein